MKAAISHTKITKNVKSYKFIESKRELKVYFKLLQKSVINRVNESLQSASLEQQCPFEYCISINQLNRKQTLVRLMEQRISTNQAELVAGITHKL